MQDKQEVLDRFCEALAALLEAGMQDLTPGAKVRVVQGLEAGELQIALAIQLEPFLAITYAAPTDRKSGPVELFRVRFDETMH